MSFPIKIQNIFARVTFCFPCSHSIIIYSSAMTGLKGAFNYVSLIYWYRVSSRPMDSQHKKSLCRGGNRLWLSDGVFSQLWIYVITFPSHYTRHGLQSNTHTASIRRIQLPTRTRLKIFTYHLI